MSHLPLMEDGQQEGACDPPRWGDVFHRAPDTTGRLLLMFKKRLVRGYRNSYMQTLSVDSNLLHKTGGWQPADGYTAEAEFWGQIESSAGQEGAADSRWALCYSECHGVFPSAITALNCAHISLAFKVV